MGDQPLVEFDGLLAADLKRKNVGMGEKKTRGFYVAGRFAQVCCLSVKVDQVISVVVGMRLQ